MTPEIWYSYNEICYRVTMAIGTQWAGYYSTHPYTRICKNTRTRILVGNNFSALPHTLWTPKCPYPHPLPAF